MDINITSVNKLYFKQIFYYFILFSRSEMEIKITLQIFGNSLELSTYTDNCINLRDLCINSRGSAAGHAIISQSDSNIYDSCLD